MKTVDAVLQALSLARTALDDPGGLSAQDMAEASQFGDRLDGHMVDANALKAYAIDKLDDAMRLLGYEEEGAIEYDLVVSVDGVFNELRPFDLVEETVEAAGEALRLKQAHPGSVVSLVVVERS